MADIKKSKKMFTGSVWKVLQEIILHRENGRFQESLRVRDTSVNMIKAEIWNKITSYFNQVRLLLLQWAQ
jgi:hypothetical protein